MEITEKEYMEIYHALQAKAEVLTHTYDPRTYDQGIIIKPGHFFGTQACVMPKQKRRYEKPDVIDLHHFLSHPCFEPLEPYERTICLAEISKDGEITYHVNEHAIGKCPWKVDLETLESCIEQEVIE